MDSVSSVPGTRTTPRGDPRTSLRSVGFRVWGYVIGSLIQSWLEKKRRTAMETTGINPTLVEGSGCRVTHPRHPEVRSRNPKLLNSFVYLNLQKLCYQ